MSKDKLFQEGLKDTQKKKITIVFDILKCTPAISLWNWNQYFVNCWWRILKLLFLNVKPRRFLNISVFLQVHIVLQPRRPTIRALLPREYNQETVLC